MNYTLKIPEGTEIVTKELVEKLLEQLEEPSDDVKQKREIGTDDLEIFTKKDYVQGIELPDSVKEIGDGAFCGFSFVQAIKLPDSVTKIGEIAFKECVDLRSIILPRFVSEIGKGAFIFCHKLNHVETSNTSVIENIGEGAFYGCQSMQLSTLSLIFNKLKNTTDITPIIFDIDIMYI